MGASGVTREFVQELIEFAPTEEQRNRGFADRQLDATVALYNMLEQNRCVYLADEVGMGKTYVALGVMGLVRYFNPSARIVVIAPRQNIQLKWIKELRNFVRLNWKVVGNRVKSIQGGPAWDPVLCDTLLDFVHEALLNADRDFFLRMTSFSVSTKEDVDRKRLRKRIRRDLPWLDSSLLSARTPETFRDAFGCALNAAVPDIDLLVIDEGHNLKHGFSARGSIRNRIMGLSLGHPEGKQFGYPWFKRRAKRLMLLSATPFEEDYAALQRQLEIFGFGDAKLRDSDGNDPLPVRDLLERGVPDSTKRQIVRRLMVRRVSGLQIAGKTFTKNMYRREWRNGGYGEHDQPIRIEDAKQRLIVGLMQKKVAEILRQERFNNSFQIGMLSSFESFLQTIKTAGRHHHVDADDEDQSTPVFDGDQEATDEERQGIDSNGIAEVVQSYRAHFGRGLPHPKLDVTAAALNSAFETGEKTLVFVRRVATVEELADRLDESFDRWIKQRMVIALPNLESDIEALFQQYERERSRRQEERFEENLVDEEEPEEEELSEHREFIDDQDEGSAETFFAWFFRGTGPHGYLSGAAFQKNRLSSTSSAYTTLFEDNHVAFLLDYPESPLRGMAELVGSGRQQLGSDLRERAYSHFRELSKQRDGYPKLYVLTAYQIAALELLEKIDGKLGENARVIIEERYHGYQSQPIEVPAGFPDAEEILATTTFFTELAKRPELKRRLWPDDPGPDFRQSFRQREQRRELLSAMARLGATYIDLYLLAVKLLGSFSLRQEAEVEKPEEVLARDFADLLEEQMNTPGFHSFNELSNAAESFELLLSVNFPEVPSARLEELATMYGAALQRQVPVGRMHGGVNKRLVKQFRMPGFPLVMITTDVLQEGEDLHTFCSRVVHYGITWTPSAMEQRTGRIDRIGSLVERLLDGEPEMPSVDNFLQVHYPHLQDTVEVLQVRRVLHRLNRFLELMHESRGEEPSDSRIDAAREILQGLGEIKKIEGPLESAFPIQPEWMSDHVQLSSVVHPDVKSQCDYLDHLWEQVRATGLIQPIRSSDPRIREGITRGLGVLSPGGGQAFGLELRSQAAGDATLLKCTCDVGPLPLREDDNKIDQLYELDCALGMVKICATPDDHRRRDQVAVAGEIEFGLGHTQLSEVVSLLSRTANSAAWIRKIMVSEDNEDWLPRIRHSRTGSDELANEVRNLIRSERLPWTQTDHAVDVQLWRNDRSHTVRLDCRNGMYVFESTVAGPSQVTRSKTYRRDLAYRVWRINALKELITFSFDQQDRLIGMIETPETTMDASELKLYIETVAKECDRLRYVLTGL